MSAIRAVAQLKRKAIVRNECIELRAFLAHQDIKRIHPTLLSRTTSCPQGHHCVFAYEVLSLQYELPPLSFGR
jgi:hypothetical protein